MLDNTTGQPLRMGRTRRLAGKHQRRAMMARDRHCRFPGCTRAVRLHAHHLTPWALGGLTDVTDMVMLCQHHHVVVHAAGITITAHRDRPGFRFTRIGGERITAQPDLIDDARRLDAQRSACPPTSAHPAQALHDHDGDLPEAMRSVRERTELYDVAASVFPRWNGARMTEGDYWAILEPAATEARSNPLARY